MKIKIGFFSVMLFLSLLLSHSYFALAAFLAVTLHELGHIIVARLLKIQLNECKIGIFGAAISPTYFDFSYKDEILLCIGGPLMNIITAAFALPFFSVTNNTVLLYFILSSVSLALLNLLPVNDFDGGRILYSILCLFCDINVADKSLSICSFITVLILWFVSVYFLIIASANLSLFIFSLSLFFKLFVKGN